MTSSEEVDTSQIQVEIAAKAENWRRQDPEISEIEQEMEEVWAEVIPAVAAIDNSYLLEQTVHLARLDPNVPVESRMGTRRLKQLIRKLNYWYVRYVTDQFNVFAGTLIRWLRNHEERVTSVEHTVQRPPSHPDHANLLLHSTLPPPSPEIAAQIATLAGSGSSLILSGGTGVIVQAINDNGGHGYGIEPNPSQLLASLQRRADVRQGDIAFHLANIKDTKFDTIVFAEIVEVLRLREIQELIDLATRVLSPSGRIIVAVADPANRHRIQSEFFQGLGMSPHSWLYLLDAADMSVRMEPSNDTRIAEIVVAEWPPHITAMRKRASTAEKESSDDRRNNKRQTIDLLIPHLFTGDATSNHTRLLKEIIESKGMNARIVSETAGINETDVIPLDCWEYEGNLAILQHSIGSRVAAIVIQKEIPIVLNYHNITPSHFFDKWHLGLRESVELGRQQLEELAPLTRRAIADSEFNALELRHMSYEDVMVAPVLSEYSRFKEQYDQGTSAIPEDSGTILFVGRIAPNKCHEHLIYALALLSQMRNKARLLLIGDASPIQYFVSLKSLAQRLGVSDQIVFAGKVSDDDLLQSYGVADVFASASEHEGFGVPLVEAMASGLPVVAYDAAAVAETVQGAGIVLADKRPATLATALDRLLGDQQLRSRLSYRGIQSARRFDITVTREQMWAALENLLEE